MGAGPHEHAAFETVCFWRFDLYKRLKEYGYMKEETEKWLKKAAHDIETAKYNFSGRIMDAAVFYSQQAAEKALKALQIERLGRFDKIHDLVRLAESINANKAILRLCDKISPSYFVSRYPDMEEEYDASEVKEILEASEEVLAWIKKELLS